MVSNTIARKGVWVRIPHPAQEPGGSAENCRPSRTPYLHGSSSPPGTCRQCTTGLRRWNARCTQREEARRCGENHPEMASTLSPAGGPAGQTHLSASCPRGTDAPLDKKPYAELLGWYLGDGHISLGRRGVYALHIVNYLKYPMLNTHVLDLMRMVKLGSRPHTREHPGCLIMTVGWKHWPCLFPQHGPGRKHERTPELESWQREIVESYPPTSCAGSSTPTAAGRGTGPSVWSPGR